MVPCPPQTMLSPPALPSGGSGGGIPPVQPRAGGRAAEFAGAGCSCWHRQMLSSLGHMAGAWWRRELWPPEELGPLRGIWGNGGAARGLTHFVHLASPEPLCRLVGSPCGPGWVAQRGSHCPEHPVPCTMAGGFPGSLAPSPQYGSGTVAVPPGCWRGACRHGPGSNRSSPKFLPRPPRDRDSQAGISKRVINKSPAGSLSAARLYF